MLSRVWPHKHVMRQVYRLIILVIVVTIGQISSILVVKVHLVGSCIRLRTKQAPIKVNRLGLTLDASLAWSMLL